MFVLWSYGEMFNVFKWHKRLSWKQNEGRPIVDGEFQTACSNACSTGAMFGDVNDKERNH
jgi:hypothetical protein